MSRDIAAAFLGEAEDKGRRMETAAARRCVGLSCFAMGNFADARRYFEEALTFLAHTAEASVALTS